MKRIVNGKNYRNQGYYLNNPDFIDLGLPSRNLWAIKNIGSIISTDVGHLFRWGEILPVPYNKKTVTEWSQYSHISNFLKDTEAIELARKKSQDIFRNDSKFVDITTYASLEKDKYAEQHINKYLTYGQNLNKEDDAAYMLSGGKCEIPTREDFEELIMHCDWVPVTKDGVSGVCIYGKNRKYIFLPSFRTEALKWFISLWSATVGGDIALHQNVIAYANILYVNVDEVMIKYNKRIDLNPIRPIIRNK